MLQTTGVSIQSNGNPNYVEEESCILCRNTFFAQRPPKYIVSMFSCDLNVDYFLTWINTGHSIPPLGILCLCPLTSLWVMSAEQVVSVVSIAVLNYVYSVRLCLRYRFRWYVIFIVLKKWCSTRIKYIFI